MSTKLVVLVALLAGCPSNSNPNLADGNTVPADGPPMVVPTPCTTTFHYTPPAGMVPQSVQVTGDWNAFVDPGTPMMPDATGAWTATVTVTPGLVAYKFIVDGNWTLDPEEHWQKYEAGHRQLGRAGTGVLVARAHASVE